MVAATCDTEAALLRAILLDPADDTPRLVYADWLEETAEQAECPTCDGCGEVDGGPHDRDGPCPNCTGSGRVSDGRRERAEFIGYPETTVG
jgi:uncharacterized protein (TIGR02996 family)